MTIPLDSCQQAAIAEICAEVYEETPLCFLGRSFSTPEDQGAHSTGFAGWRFASWLLSIWLEAGLIDIAFDPDRTADADGQVLGWLGRAEHRAGYGVLHVDDARALLANVSLWHAAEATGGFYPLRSDATDGMEHGQWLRAAREATTPAPALVANPEMIDSIEWQNAHASWEDLSPGLRLYVVRWDSGSGVQWGRVLAESRQQVLAVNRNFNVWPEKLAEWSPELAEHIAQVKKWVPEVASEGFELRPIT